MKLKILSIAISVLMLSFVFTSCNEADDTARWQNIVTYQGMQNNYSAVSWQQDMNSQPITLLVGVDLSTLTSGTSTPPGTRIYIDFITEDNVSTLSNNMIIERKNINELFVVKTLQPSMESQLPPQGWNDEPQQYIISLYRNGSYLNMSSLVSAMTNTETMKMTFYVDPQTVGRETVISYLSYENPTPYDRNQVSYTYLNCMDITSLMNSGSKNLIVNFNNVNPGVNQYVTYGSVATDYQSVTIPLN